MTAAESCGSCGQPFAGSEAAAGWKTCEHCPTPEQMDIPGVGQVTAYRSLVDGALVVEIDTPEATAEAGTADADGVPVMRVVVNDGEVWENPAPDTGPPEPAAGGVGNALRWFHDLAAQAELTANSYLGQRALRARLANARYLAQRNAYTRAHALLTLATRPGNDPAGYVVRLLADMAADTFKDDRRTQ